MGGVDVGGARQDDGVHGDALRGRNSQDKQEQARARQDAGRHQIREQEGTL